MSAADWILRPRSSWRRLQIKRRLRVGARDEHFMFEWHAAPLRCIVCHATWWYILTPIKHGCVYGNGGPPSLPAARVLP